MLQPNKTSPPMTDAAYAPNRGEVIRVCGIYVGGMPHRMAKGNAMRIRSNTPRRVVHTFHMIAVCAVIAMPARAADAGGAETANDANLLEEIRVTARRRSELQTEVPVSITAISADFLERQNIQSFADYATKVPNLTFQYGAGGNSGITEGRVTSIRGIAGLNTTAFYINDTPIPAAVSPQLLNLERIEVLKGPQGTLFGASSMGGNLRFITREPSLAEGRISTEFGAGATKSAGADVDANASGNIVVVPSRLAIELAGGYTRESGYITRRFPDASGALVFKDDQGRTETWSASFSMRAALTDRLELSLNGLAQNSDLQGWPAAYVPLPDYRVVSYTLDRDRDLQEYSKDRWDLESLILEYSGDAFSII